MDFRWRIKIHNAILFSCKYIHIERWKAMWFKRHLGFYWVIYIIWQKKNSVIPNIYITQYHLRSRLIQIAFQPSIWYIKTPKPNTNRYVRSCTQMFLLRVDLCEPLALYAIIPTSPLRHLAASIPTTPYWPQNSVCFYHDMVNVKIA
jgi:hypothetical protein